MEYVRYLRIAVANMFRRYIDFQDYIPKKYDCTDENATKINIYTPPSYDMMTYHALGKTTRSRVPSSKAQLSVLP
jgi:hypothetical protein